MKLALADLLELTLDGPDADPHQSSLPTLQAVFDQPRYFPGLYAFAFVRNPWSRLVSCYRDKILLQAKGYTRSTLRPGIANCLAAYEQMYPAMPFAEFIRVVADIPDEAADPHFRSQLTFLADDGPLKIDYVGRFENLANDLRQIQRDTGMPQFNLPVSQATGTGNQHAEYYDDRTAELVAIRYAEDINQWNYCF